MDELILNAEDVSARPFEPLRPGIHGVDEVVLWREGPSYAGLMRVAPGAHLPAHRHREMAHHVLVTHGSARVLGHVLQPGSYWFIPPGHDHGLEALEEGCTLFFVYAPPASEAAGTEGREPVGAVRGV